GGEQRTISAESRTRHGSTVVSNPLVKAAPTRACHESVLPARAGFAGTNAATSLRPDGGSTPPVTMTALASSNTSVPNGETACGLHPGDEAARSHEAEGAPKT